MSTYDKARNGDYQNRLPYAGTKENHLEVRHAYRAEETRLVAQFKADLEAEYGLSGHPKADKLFALAWDQGHSSGYAEVAQYYAEFAELVS